MSDTWPPIILKYVFVDLLSNSKHLEDKVDNVESGVPYLLVSSKRLI